MGAMNELINQGTVRSLAKILSGADGEWLAVEKAAERVDGLQLRARSDLVAQAILSDNDTVIDDEASGYDRLAVTIRRALETASFTGWMIWPVSEAVTTAARRGYSNDSREAQERFDDGLLLLAELTPRLTAEFAIRRFLASDLDRALTNILPWTRSPDEHVRRLASEGTRPFLPWAVRVASLTSSPEKTVPILDALRTDPSEYVRRSVANHLNDLSRQSPALVAQTAERWLAEPDENTAWVVRHGLRTLIKKADPGALALMGFSDATLRVSPIALADEMVTLPGSLALSFSITNAGDDAARLAIDYVVSYVKSSGALAEKVFKLSTRDVQPGETLVLRKRHAIHQMTTRVHYPGTHVIELQINGRRYSRRSFEVEIPSSLASS
ncbi:DNA alkylation repair protein [Agreia sp. VKM Ac-1783]|uniref:DNA alkylation repair protein n=1 Tax=Agreia sp. VKM Ac-1783 TaxID=1938889 RepID=UPI000A2AD097|nr:DNA alkylation repair protein [Agreia sp. VKM Ac-1783]SMQ59430.1 3-methyladenine DNA glycosylase AlkC [Agreia sp. VKM Ac-1783]